MPHQKETVNVLLNFTVRYLAGAATLSLNHHVHSSSGSHLASYPMDTRGFFPGVKQLVCEADPRLHQVPGLRTH